MQKIALTKGYYAVVDDIDYEKVSAHKWSAQVMRKKDGSVRTVYAVRGAKNDRGLWRLQLLHRFISGAISPMCVDHIDGDGLNNIRSNLRICTQAENAMNVRPVHGASSKYKGVSRIKSSGRWRAYIKKHGKHMFIGSFGSEREAAFAYNAKAIEMFGQYAKLNVLHE